jgi:hypothetical protein
MMSLINTPADIRKQKFMLKGNHAALLCSHVHAKSRPILRVHFSAPIDEGDSGWQFLCGDYHDDDPKVWSLSEVCELDASVKNLISSMADQNFEMTFTRPTVDDTFKEFKEEQ